MLGASGPAEVPAPHHAKVLGHEYTLAANTLAADAVATTLSAAGAASAQSQASDAIFVVQLDHAADPQLLQNQTSRDRKVSKGGKRARARADVQAEHEPSQGTGYLTVNPLFAGSAGSAGVAVETTSSGDEGEARTGYRPRKGSLTLGGFDSDQTTMEI